MGDLSCFFFYAEDILNSKAVQEYSLDNINNIVDQLYKAECRQITIVGGEPLKDHLKKISSAWIEVETPKPYLLSHELRIISIKLLFDERMTLD